MSLAPVDRRTIPYLHWQPRLDRNAPAFGEIVHGLDDLEQTIHTIVLTEKGTVPLAPEKCTELEPWIDRPPAVATPHYVREIWDALATWEPRLIVTEVKPVQVAFHHWRFPVFWYPRADVLRQIRMTEVTYRPDGPIASRGG